LYLYYVKERRIGGLVADQEIIDALSSLREEAMDMLSYREQLSPVRLQEHRDCISSGPHWLYNFRELLTQLITMNEDHPLYFCSLFRVTEFVAAGGQLQVLPPPTLNGQPIALIALQGGRKKRRTRYKSKSRSRR
jgi:hypothetical protein